MTANFKIKALTYFELVNINLHNNKNKGYSKTFQFNLFSRYHPRIPGIFFFLEFLFCFNRKQQTGEIKKESNFINVISPNSSCHEILKEIYKPNIKKKLLMFSFTFVQST